jgi:dethiobiotin synthetase
MKKAYFITGTDTGVGKTLITGGIAGALVERGLKVGVMKPVETGCYEQNGDLFPADAMFLKEEVEPEVPLDIVNPYRFKEPLAPSVAARIEEVEIDLRKIKKCFLELSRGKDVVLVEGAGGLLVPLNHKKTSADLIKLLKLKLVVVAASRLGVLNHTLLTVRHAEELGIKVAGVIMNHPEPSADLSINYNMEELKRLGVPIIGELPYLMEGELPKMVKERLDLDALV